jgi:predicted metal-dependent phosphoesterase TrpH
MGKADLHIHTNQGDGIDSIERIFEYVEEKTDLDVIAITEHDGLEVALEARELWARGRYRFDFVCGAEMTTLEGHVVTLYLEEPLPSLRHVEKTLEGVRRQGGVAFVPHPMSWLTRSIGPGTFERLMRRKNEGLWFDGVEAANAGPTARLTLSKARQMNEERYKLAPVGASDAHFVQAIGSAYTEFPGHSAADLRRAFAEGNTSAHQTCYPSMADVGWARVLALPLAGLGATPRRLGWKRTAWSFVGRYFA